MTFNLILRSRSTDACDRLRARGVCPALVQRIHCRMDSLVLESTGKKAPASGLQAKPRACYGGATDLTVGRNAEKDISDLVVNRENMVVLCCKVASTGDVSIGEASVDVTATRTDGRTVREFVEHAIGSLKSPMTDALLETKLQSPAPLVLRSAQTMALAAARGAIGESKDAAASVPLLAAARGAIGAANSVRTVVGLSSPTA